MGHWVLRAALADGTYFLLGVQDGGSVFPYLSQAKSLIAGATFHPPDPCPVRR